ncbi:hypothetical protein GOODEAATRI_007777, partial [Goodea atripinnis]
PLSSHTPPPEDFPSHLDPAPTDVVFSPIDYEGKKPSSLKPEAYGTDHKPDATDVPEFDDLADAYSPELPVSECGNEDLTGPDVPDEPNQSKIISNGITDPETKVYTETAYGDDQDNPPQKQPFQAVTGQEEAMYQAKVNVTTKGSKNDLPVKNGDVISIIRTTKCPKGKWLARDSSNTYGYVSVDHLEMDFKEMLELGKKTPRNSTITEAETTTDGRYVSHLNTINM